MIATIALLIPTEMTLIIVGVVILVLFGAERLPKLAKSLGQAKKEFENVNRAKSEPPIDVDASPPSTTAAPTTPVTPSTPPTTQA